MKESKQEVEREEAHACCNGLSQHAKCTRKQWSNPARSLWLFVFVPACVCIHACVCACVRVWVVACVRVFVRACVRASVRACVRSGGRACMRVDCGGSCAGVGGGAGEMENEFAFMCGPVLYQVLF